MNQDSMLGLPDRGPAVAGVDWLNARRSAPHRATTPNVAGELRQPTMEGETAFGLPEDAEPEIVRVDEFILPRHHFLKELQREQRRTDRSTSPLSVAVFRFNGKQGDERERAENLLEILRRNKRESDMLGDLGDHSIAMMLPDTDPQGLQRFVTRIGKRTNELESSLATGTYPDNLFDDLLRRDDEVGRSLPLYIDERRKPDKLGKLVKRCIDVVGASVALLLLSPLMLILAAVIARTSPGPVIFKQIRLGKGGRPFVFYKFRSMLCNMDDRVHRDYVLGLIAGGQESAAHGSAPRTWSKLKSDARVTPVGRFIRETSIDELPQLFNVLKGDMSLVGPRPAMPYEAEKYQSWHLRRLLEIKPGISGLWQISGYGVTFDDMVRLDLRYLRDWSLLLDLKIMVKTVTVVLRRNGAG